MAIAKWSTPLTRSGDLAGTALNSLANGSASAFITYDNASSRDLYSNIAVLLGSINPAAGGSITLRVYATDGTSVPDINGGVFDSYTAPLASGASAKVVTFPLVRLYPFSLRLQIVNNSGVTLAGSNNSLFCTDYNEEVT